MMTMQRLVVAAALAIGMAAPASAAITDPEVIIYRFPGVSDNGGAENVGIATAFHCTNFSGATETMRFVTRGSSGGLITNLTHSIAHLQTITAVTHVNAAYPHDLSLSTGGGASPGTTAIAATSVNIVCTAMTIDAAATKPIGVALRGIRFSPAPGSQE